MVNKQIEKLQASMDFEKKRGSITSQRLPSMNKLKKQRDNIIASVGINQLKAQVENNKKILESFPQKKYEVDQLLEQATIALNYLKNNPQILN